jgi:hypothetical protein
LKRRTLLLGACVVLLATGPTRVAQAEDRAAAQLLFDQGKALVAEGKLPEACRKFEASAQLSQTPGVRLNLVDCWAATGRTASAWAMADEALGLAERAGDASAATAARERRVALQKKLTYLNVTVPPAAAVPGLAITRDGQPMPQAEWGTPVPVDMGTHEVTAEAPGRPRWSVTRSLTEPGTTVTLTIPVPGAETAVEAPPAPVPVTATHGSTARTLGLASAALGVVGLGIGTALAVTASAKKHTYEAHEAPDGSCADATCQSESHAAFTAGTWSTVAFVAGGAFAAAGAYLWFFAPGGGTTVTPVAGPQSAGLAVTGGW